MIITLDFETYYDKEFTLKKLTTEEYIRSDLFEVIGFSVKIDSGPSEWFSGTMDEMYDYLHELPWNKAFLLAHNTRFDGFILSDRFGIFPRGYLDTLSMSRAIHGVNVGASLAFLAEKYQIGAKGEEVLNALGKRRSDFSVSELEKYAEYCINDVEITYKLFQILRVTFPKEELRVIDITLRMFIDPILVIDSEKLSEHILHIQNQKKKLLEDSHVDVSELMSNPKYAALLEKLGVSPPKKISLRTGKETFAFAKTDEAHKKLLEHPDISVQTLVSARFGVKTTLEETRSQSLLGISMRGALPVPLKYYAAHTGRWGGDDKINMQNLPSRKSNKTIKDTICAPAGYSLINCDSSQIEARVIAWIAGQKDLVDSFAKGQDVYKLMATKIYKVAIDEVTDEQRRIAKAVVLGCGFGMGAVRLMEQFKSESGINIPLKECRELIRIYRKQCSHITELWKQGNNCLNAIVDDYEVEFGVVPCVRFKQEMGGFILPNGLTQIYPGLHRVMRDDSSDNADEGPVGKEEFQYNTRNGFTRIYGGKVVENIVQAIARCIIAQQLILISERYRVVLIVHDAIVCVVPDEETDEARRFIETCMRTNPAWAKGLPLDCESSVGKTYGSCKKIDIYNVKDGLNRT